MEKTPLVDDDTLLKLYKLDRLNLFYKLDWLNVGPPDPRPQVVVLDVCTDQHVIQGLIGIPFRLRLPYMRGDPMKIMCRHRPSKEFSVSIASRYDATQKCKRRLHSFRRRGLNLNKAELEEAIQDAGCVLTKEYFIKKGEIILTSDEESEDGDEPVRTNDRRRRFHILDMDMLIIEICGPDQDNMDILIPSVYFPLYSFHFDALTRKIEYLFAPGPFITIAVLSWERPTSCTEAINDLVDMTDPNSSRTFKVLADRAKPYQIAITHSTSNNVDLDCSFSESRELYGDIEIPCGLKEKSWMDVSDPRAIPAVREKLRSSLTELHNQQFARLKSEIEERLHQIETWLPIMTLPRENAVTQRTYLGAIAGQFEILTHATLNTQDSVDSILLQKPSMKLISQINEEHEKFISLLEKWGHEFRFNQDTGEKLRLNCWCGRSLSSFPELKGLIGSESYGRDEPWDQGLMADVWKGFKLYDDDEAPDFLCHVFRKQSKKWEGLLLDHIKDIVCMIHGYLFQLLLQTCPEKRVRQGIWKHLLVPKLCQIYRSAMEHVTILVKVERERRSDTFIHRFTDTLDRKRAIRARDLTQMGIAAQDMEHRMETGKYEYVNDAFKTYYEEARERLLENIYRQVIMDKLLDGDGSPMKLFNTQMIMQVNDEKLERIAGEREAYRERQYKIDDEIVILKAALKLLD